MKARKGISACLAVVLAGIWCAAAVGQPEKKPQGSVASRESVAVTIYNNNFGVVKDRRVLELEEGVQAVRFENVASRIDPTSVNFSCGGEGISVLEQNYQYDLADLGTLLAQYEGRTIRVRLQGGGADEGLELEGRLLNSTGESLFLREADTGRIHVLDRGRVEQITLSGDLEGFYAQPTLIWTLRSPKAGKASCQAMYMTEGISWEAVYSAVLNEGQDQLNLTGWASIQNESGTAYKDARVKLIAGDVQRVEKTPPPGVPVERMMMARGEMAVADRFQEQAFSEYHMYTLERPVTIARNERKQIELMPPAEKVQVNREYVYEPVSKPEVVQTKLEFQNTEENGLGAPLPAGEVRVYRRNADEETVEFIGEDRIDHTAAKEEVSLYIGNAYDIVPEHTVVDTQQAQRARREVHRVKLANRKEAAVVVYVEHTFPRYMEWEVLKADLKYERKDAHTLRFAVSVQPGEERTFQYMVSMEW